jgi:hypothetical protein
MFITEWILTLASSAAFLCFVLVGYRLALDGVEAHGFNQFHAVGVAQFFRQHLDLEGLLDVACLG